MSGTGLNFRQYLRAVIKRLWLVVLLAALAAGGVYMRGKSQPRQYAAETTLVVTAPVFTPPMSPAGSAGGGGGGSSLQSRGGSTVFADIIQLVSARPVAERVAKQLNLKGPEEARTGISASQIRNTSLLKLKAVSQEPSRSARLASATAEQLIAYFQEINRRDARSVRLYIEQQLAEARARLQASDRLIQAFKERRGIVDIVQARSQASSDVAATRTQRENALLSLRETEARLAEAKARLARESLERVNARTTRDNPVFTQLQSRLTALEIQRAEASQTFTAEHPRMKQLDGEIADMRQRMLAEAKTTLGEQTIGANPIHGQLLSQVVAFEVDRAAFSARAEALGYLGRRLQAGLLTIPSMETAMTALTRDNRVLETNYTALAGRYQEALLRENEAGYVPAGVQVVEPAIAPTSPISAGLPLQTAAAGLVGLLLGVMSAIFLEASDDKIRSPQDAERTLGVPVLAEVPDMSVPRVAPSAAALLVAVILTMMAGGAVVAARAVGDGTSTTPTAVSVFVRLGHDIDQLTARFAQAVR